MGEVVTFVLLLCISAAALTPPVRGEDPYLFFTWNVTYGTIAPLGVPQQGILINGEFPGPNINSTTNNNIVVNVINNLDEPFLLTWCSFYFLFLFDPFLLPPTFFGGVFVFRKLIHNNETCC